MVSIGIDWIGYIATLVVAYSLTIKERKKLHLINIFGTSIFLVYSIIIWSVPFIICNIMLIGVNIWKLKN